MSTPPYQNQPPYGHPPHGGGPQGQRPEPPRGPQRPGLSQKVLTFALAACLIGGLGYWVYDYNATPSDGAPSKAEADHRKKNPREGDCVKIKDPDGTPEAEVVDCDSDEAEYRWGEKLDSAGQTCDESYDYGIKTSRRRGASFTTCYVKL